jgi:cytochrome c553
VPKFPALAGQSAKYLESQLSAFKNRSRGDPDALSFMWGMAARLDDASITALADYFSRQKPPGGLPVKADLVDRGKELYLHGDSTAEIPPCAACHGANAEGRDNFPRLAGQHAQYLLGQLKAFRNHLRADATMDALTKGMNADDMAAVAGYLQSLGTH